MLSPDGAKPLNSPEKAIAWFAEAWEVLHREASKRHRKNGQRTIAYAVDSSLVSGVGLWLEKSWTRT